MIAEKHKLFFLFFVCRPDGAKKMHRATENIYKDSKALAYD